MNIAGLLGEHGIDLGWLAERLIESSMAPSGAELASMDAKGIGTGQVGENVRCRLQWSAGTGPSSVVVKLPSANELSRSTGGATRAYIREVGFYRDMAATIPIRTPAVYHVSEDRQTNGFILLMEDIAPAEQGDQLTGCSPEQARLAVDTIADLHGPTWDRQELVELDWVDEATASGRNDRVELFRHLFPGFADRYRETLEPEELDLGQWLFEAIPELLAAPDGPRCLVHGDFRLDNILFGTGDPAPAITTVDWQTVSFGFPLADIAYFLSAGLTADDRRSNEPELLDIYRKAMERHGVTLSPSDVDRGYRLGSASGYLMAVIASQIVEQTERGDAMFVSMAAGAAKQMADVDLPALLGS